MAEVYTDFSCTMGPGVDYSKRNKPFIWHSNFISLSSNRQAIQRPAEDRWKLCEGLRVVDSSAPIGRALKFVRG